LISYPASGHAAASNLAADSIEGRETWYQVDRPPPEKKPELVIGWHIA